MNLRFVLNRLCAARAPGIGNRKPGMMLLYNLLLPEATLGLPLWLACVFIAMLGAIIGSFLNVIVHRLPREESIVFPNSRCPHCGTAIKPYDNIPVISYLILRGRCRSCGAAISPRYPAIEAFTAFLYIAVFLSDGATPALAFDLVFTTALIALIFIDAEHMLLPNAITYPGILFAILARVAVPLMMGRPFFDDLEAQMTGAPAHWPMWAASLLGAGIGALAGGGSLWLMGWLWERMQGVEAMGLGDVKMMFMVGAYMGWRLTTVTIFLAVLSGSLTGIALMLVRGQKDMKMRLPFGIFLGAGAIVSLLVGGYIVAWYASKFQ